MNNKTFKLKNELRLYYFGMGGNSLNSLFKVKIINSGTK